MAYQINKTDGSLLVEIVDSAIDQNATDITLIGRNVSGYGEFINENFVKILENFANDSEPNNPIIGQLWFDTAENRLKVYDGNGFKIGSGPIISGDTPTNPTQGDIWIDSVENQLYFYDGTEFTLAGPIYKESQGLSGFQVESIVDTIGQSRTIVKLLIGNSLLGIFSRETVDFTPSASIPGFSGTIGPGFNQSTLANQKFRVTASKADSLIDSLGNQKFASDFMLTSANTGSTGEVKLTNVKPLLLGPSQNNEFQVDSLLFAIQSNSLNQNFRLRVRRQAGILDAITVLTQNKRIGLWKDTPAYPVDIAGDVRIVGDLLVEGNTTTINSVNLTVEDHIIEIAKASDSSASDSYADKGGIVLKGTTDHSILWHSSDTSWKSSENFDIVSSTGGARSYKINGVNVLEYDGATYRLTANVTQAPGLTSFGIQTQFTVDNLYLNNSRIQSLSTNSDIELEPNGTGNISLIGSPRITGLANPVAATDAVTLGAVEDYVRARNICFSMDITGLTNPQIATILSDIAPEAYYEEGTECRIHCTSQVVSYPAINLTSSTSPVTTGDFVKSFISVDNSANVSPKPNEPVLQDFTVNPINIGSATVSVTRVNKLFTITSGSWTWDSDF
jgi:hypothetical protein